ncbi:hypothetical protein [Streptomyces sp. AMCC400023]|uniref:hypothetical protein n=1 Tax=Streptomyces sp. AMCC400023 TaxID=2056258 RepID=UPI001F384396|nr:hypothetical protein [Streptomyces sp. AMCC400023]UJV42042.1 hypothetical protein CVT30_21310 [Streptomyces sp. AMCC400023]
MTGFKPHPAVHAPWMFMCAMDDPDAVIISYAENPGAQIASALLEDVGDWHHAIKNLQRTNVPDGVVTALDAFHDAVCGWVEWNEQTAKRTETTP